MMVFSILSHYCSRLPSLRVGNRRGIPTYGLDLNTRALPCITDIHKLFYVNSNYSSRTGKKIIPQNIYHLLDPIALAHWIQGDGYKHGNGLRLATHSFSIQDTVTLVNVLMLKFGLNCTSSSRLVLLNLKFQIKT